MSHDDVQVALDLTVDERRFIGQALTEYFGSASSVPLPLELLGVTDWVEFDALIERLRHAVDRREALSGLDWQRVQFLIELSFGSDMLGAGVEFGTCTGIRDYEGIDLLRSLQRKIIRVRGPHSLFRGPRRPQATEEERRRQIEEFLRGEAERETE